jgi:hypothetical protein
VEPAPVETKRAVRADREVRKEDRIEISRPLGELAGEFKAHRERLERSIESRRKLVEAVRDVVNAGGYDRAEAALRAAEGFLRRGASSL